MTGRFFTLILLAAFLCGAGQATAEPESIEVGRQLIETNCSPCHSVEKSGTSPHPDAPPFRTLSQGYPVSDLEEALAEGIMTGHEDMPEFVAEPEQIDDMIAYLESIQEK